MFRIILQIIITAFTISSAIAQDPTDVYLFQLQISPDHICHVYQPKFLSGFNRGGYTNQPWFVSNDEILLSARMRGDTQNDIYLLSLSTKKLSRLPGPRQMNFLPESIRMECIFQWSDKLKVMQSINRFLKPPGLPEEITKASRQRQRISAIIAG